MPYRLLQYLSSSCIYELLKSFESYIIKLFRDCLILRINLVISGVAFFDTLAS